MDDKVRNLIIKLTHRFPEKGSAILPALTMIQKRSGRIDEADMEEIAKIMKVPEARVFSAASFYSMLSLKKIGKYHIQVCNNIVCSILGNGLLWDHISERLGISEGEITDDGLFSISAVECLGSCGYGPAMQINMDHYENMTVEKVDHIIDSIRRGEWWL